MSPYELFTTTDVAELWSRIDAAGERFLGLARDVDEALSLRNSTWSANDVVGHVLTVVRRYTQGPTLGDTPRDVDRINADELATIADVPYRERIDDLARELKVMREMWSSETLDLHGRVPFHGGTTVDIAAALTNMIGELLLHGYDVARSAERPWPLHERDCVLILNGVLQILPAYANRSSEASLRLKLVTKGAQRWLLAFDRGQLTSEPASRGQEVDVVVRTPASTLVLALYSRLSPWAAACKGMYVVGGRHPWRVLRLGSLLEKP